MPKPIVIAYHLIWTAYGWWLPNDPRGSGSKMVHHPSIAELGPRHFGRKKQQPVGKEIRQFYDRAKHILRHDLRTLSRKDMETAACGLADAISEHRYTCYACAIMPDHAHLIIRKHKHSAEEMIEKLQALSRKRLIEARCRKNDHPVWTIGGWKRFLDHPQSIHRVIQYIERNPLESGLPSQQWQFVKPYDNWPFHKGHDPYSPYTQRLRTR